MADFPATIESEIQPRVETVFTFTDTTYAGDIRIQADLIGTQVTGSDTIRVVAP